MVKSKKDKKISLTKTNKKDLAWKQKIINDIRRCVGKYPNLFVFSVRNMRNNLLKDLRNEWKQNSRFVFGKNRVMQIALGRTVSEEIDIDLHKIANRLSGQCGLLFTEKSKEQVLEWADNFWAIEYARSGFIATETVELSAGPLESFTHSMEAHLRSLGLPTKLQKGIVTLTNNYKVCEKGRALTPEQARILKLIAKPMAKFRLTIKCSWNKVDGFGEHSLAENSRDSGNEDEKANNVESDESNIGM